MAGDINVNEWLTTKNLAIAAALVGYVAGTKTPRYVDKKLEEFGTRIARGIAYKTNGGSSSSDPLERLYQVVSSMVDRQEETLGLLKKYMAQAGG